MVWVQSLSSETTHRLIRDIQASQGSLGIRLSFQLFSADHIAWLLIGERTVYEASVAVPCYKTVEYV